MTLEDIALFLDLNDGFTSGDVERAFSQGLAQSRQALAQAGSKQERMMVKARLDRFLQKESEIRIFVERAKAVEEAEKQLAKAEVHIKEGKARMAAVPYGRLKEINRAFLPQELQDRIDEIGVSVEDEVRKADLAVKAEERAAREAEERARREAEAERQRRVAEEKARRDAEEKTRREAELAARKAAEAAERKEREEKARQEAMRKIHELAEKEAREEAGREARERAGKLALEEAEKVARDAAAQLSEEASAKLAEADAALQGGDERKARELFTGVMEKTKAVKLDDALMALMATLSKALNAKNAEKTVLAAQRDALAKVAALVSRGEYDGAADVLCVGLKGPTLPEERLLWESLCQNELCEAAKAFVSARLVEARIAEKAGYKAAVGPLLDVIMRVSAFLPPIPEVREECARLRGASGASVPGVSPCNRLTIEYLRGDMEKRRLHVLTVQSATFGRSTSSDVVVRVMASMGDAEKVNRLIGRGHFIVENTGNFVNVIDGSRVENGTIKASTNGVFIDGRRVVYPRSIEGRGETLHIASQQLASHVAHWSLNLVDANSVGTVPEAVRAIHPDGKWPRIAGLCMSRMDEMPEDVLFVWDAVPLGVVDPNLSKYWLVRSGEGILLWNGATLRDVATAGEAPHVMSFGRLSHIGG